MSALPENYGFVILTIVASFFLSAWHSFRCTPFRKRAGIPYPKSFADSNDFATANNEKKQALYLFNCAQRAQGNWQENHPSVALAVLIAGLRYPVTASVMGLGWMVNRVVYAVGYTNKEQKEGRGRLRGSAGWFVQLGLFLLAGWTGVGMVM
ncbi:hypothetical protein K470DRAFT_269390 [Piedraia hortae CBS 480.64]|uniref:Membrane-associated proteins in eicosanoid and glutathione metabolism n=1 Tax=Piedraia hortae CBS 480.64 TaxID=1314780 RepID=A0A6A7C576_9PEZI|nr:hypothetical protein K470DRAFT_269390 [Piedraia hortae CBS 480.64]